MSLFNKYGKPLNTLKSGSAKKSFRRSSSERKNLDTAGGGSYRGGGSKESLYKKVTPSPRAFTNRSKTVDNSQRRM